MSNNVTVLQWLNCGRAAAKLLTNARDIIEVNVMEDPTYKVMVPDSRGVADV